MAKCLTVTQKDTCPNGSVDAKCVPYTGSNLNNLNVTSGMNLSQILSNINNVVGGGTPQSLKIETRTFEADGTYTAPSGSWLLGIAVSPDITLNAFKVGTTPGGNNIIFDQIVNGEQYSTFNQSYFSPISTTFYFGGISASTEIKLLIFS